MSAAPQSSSDFLHWCPYTNALLDEHNDEIIHCRCFASREFLDVQDKRAVEIDLRRGAKE